MLTLSQKLAAGIVATTAIATVALAAPQAQAASTSAQDFFGTPATLSESGWTATGIRSTPSPLLSPLAEWDASLFAPNGKFAFFTVSRSVNDPLLAPPTIGPVSTRYVIEARKNIKTIGFWVDYSPISTGSGGVATSTFFSDAGFTKQVSIMSLNFNVFDGPLLIMDKAYDTLWVEDSFTLTNGVLSSYTNSYTTVPEPMTLLGASAAVAFGAAFKRRQAKKG